MKTSVNNSTSPKFYDRVSEVLDKYAVFDDFPKNNIHFVTSFDLFDSPHSDVLELYVCKQVDGALLYEYISYLPNLTQEEYDYILDWYRNVYDITYDVDFVEPCNISRPL